MKQTLSANLFDRAQAAGDCPSPSGGGEIRERLRGDLCRQGAGNPRGPPRRIGRSGDIGVSPQPAIFLYLQRRYPWGSFRLLVFVLVTLGLARGNRRRAVRPRSEPLREKMERLFTSPNQATNSDFAFWGDHAFVGYYTGGAGFPPGTGPRGGVRIFDISDPAAPQLVRISPVTGQNDPILWDRNGNGVADLMLLAVDTTMAAPQCGAARVAGGTSDRLGGRSRLHDERRSGESLHEHHAGQGRVHGLRRTHDHAVAGGAGQAAGLRLVVPAGGGTHVRRHGVLEHRQSVRRRSRQPRQSAARRDPDRRGAAGEPGGGPGARRAAGDQLSGRPGRQAGVG